MTLIEKLKAMFTDVPSGSTESTSATTENYADYKLKDGITIIRIDGPVEKGQKVSVVDEDGLTPAPAGEHIVPEIGKIIVVDSDGVITDIKDYVSEDNVEDQEMEKVEKYSALNSKFSAYATLKDGRSIFTSDDLFTIGSPLFISTYTQETGYQNTPVDSDVEMADGTIFKVVEGKISEITKPVSENMTEEEMAAETDTNTEPVVSGDTKTETTPSDMESRMKMMEDKMSEMEQAIMMMADKMLNKEDAPAIEDEMTKMRRENDELRKKNLLLSKEPATDPVKTKKIDKTEVNFSINGEVVKVNKDMINFVSEMRNKK